MSIAIRLKLSNTMLTSLYERLQKAYDMGQLRLIKRIHALLYIVDGKDVAEVANILKLSLQSVYNYVKAFILKQLDSLVYRFSPGRPAKTSKTPKPVRPVKAAKMPLPFKTQTKIKISQVTRTVQKTTV